MKEFDLQGFLSEKEGAQDTQKLGADVMPVSGQAKQKGSALAAQFRQDNIIGAALTHFNRNQFTDYEPEEGFNWAQNVPQGYLDYAPRFALAKSKGEANHIRNQIDMENADKALIGNHPVSSFFTGFIANALDPTILLPGTSLYKSVKGGARVGLAAVEVGAASGVQAAAQEAVISPMQYARTGEESAFNILASTIIGSAMGGAGAFIHTKMGQKAVNDTAKILNDGTISPVAKVGDDAKQLGYEAFKSAEKAIKEGDDSVGAMASPERDLSGEELVMADRMAKVYGVTMGRITPLVRGLTSPFKWVRALSGDIMENNLYLKKNTSEYGYQETQHALETQIKLDRGQIDRAMSKYTDIFYEANGIPPSTFGRSIKHTLDRNKTVSFEDFERGTWLSIIRGGSDNPHFKKAGDLLKQEVFDPWKDRMIEIGELPPNVDVKTAVGYFTRVYNVDKINDPRYTGRWEIDDNDTIYTRTKKYVLRINDVLKQKKPEIDEINNQVSKLKAQETRFKTTEREAKYLRKTKDSDKELADKIYGKAFEKNKDAAQPAIDRWIEKNKLSDQEIGELREELAELRNGLELVNAAQKDKQLHASDLSKYQALQKKLADAEREKAESVRWAEKAIEDAKAENQALKDEAKAAREAGEDPIEFSLKKLGVLQEKLNKAKALGTKSVKQAQKDLDKFQSSFTKEKIGYAKAIGRTEERIRSAERIKEVELNNIGKDIDRKRKAIVNLLKEREAYIYRKVDRLEKLEQRLKEKPLEPIIKAREDLQKKLKEDFIPDLFTSKGEVRNILETDLEARTAIESIIDNIRGLNDNRYNNPLLRGIDGGSPNSTKNRHFLIPDEEIEPFLITSPTKVVPMFANGVIAHYRITKWAQKNGLDTKAEGIKHHLDKVLDEYKDLLKEAVPPKEKEKLIAKYEPLLEKAKDPLRPDVWTPEYRSLMEKYNEELRLAADPAYAAYLTKRFKEAEKDVTASLDILMGIYGNGSNAVDTKLSKFIRTMGQYNFLRMMGYMVSSSFTDPGMIVAKNGMGSFVYEGMKPIIQGLKGAKFNLQLVKDIGRSTQAYQGLRLRSFVDQKGLAQETGLFSKAFQKMVDTFGNVSGMSYWMDMMQNIAGNVSISRTLRTIDGVLNGKKVSKSDRERLAHIGISESDMKHIHDQWKQHGGQEDGTYFINWAEWNTNSADGLASLESFKLATIKDMDATIVIPGVGDKPLAAHQWYGQMMLQFKSFALAATNKLLVSGLQRQDAEFAQGVITLLALGELVYCFTKMAKNQEISDKPEDHLYEMVDRSGLLGILMEVPLTMQKFGLLPGAGTSRYNSRGAIGALGGPTIGTIEDIAYVLNRFRNRNETPLTTKDVDKLLKLMPYQNLWYLDALNRNLGLTKSLALSAGFEDAE